ncbi:DUF916 domain-containing protein [Candidatus Gracilibacteria bacterium]|nr:DUF916 domain-containing protein [Candidatus Gracilibacteria bacterium]NUJ98339.1 DUF916 domain-containing protein [Candidatus Gracilibacteria bacterium]NUJ99306.1 DUF916 domain-containing protein [Candidatus Gracilibacteria bacterium]
MNRKISSFFIGILFLIPFYQHTFGAEIDVTVSPVRYELTSDTGSSVTKSIKIINNSEEAVNLNINAKDCNTFNNSGTPKCFPPEQNTNMRRTLAPWISSFPETINIPARGEENITLTINIPSDANPGGHYGALFFSYGNSSTNSTINTIKEVGVILLLHVNGEVEVEAEIKDIFIQVNGGGDGKGAKDNTDISLKETILNFIHTNLLKDNKEENDEKNEDDEKITIDFGVTFENTGNTHIKPKGEIILEDEDGNVIKRVGEETIKNEDGIIIGKKIVDYIPINDEDGNVLPGSERVFSQDWKGFPYKKIDEDGEISIDYKSFSDYYTEKNLKDKDMLMMREQVKEREKTEKMKAKINIKYKGKDDEDIDFNSAKDFDITYKEQYIGINWLVVGPIGFVVFIFFIILVAKRRKKKEE